MNLLCVSEWKDYFGNNDDIEQISKMHENKFNSKLRDNFTNKIIGVKEREINCTLRLYFLTLRHDYLMIAPLLSASYVIVIETFILLYPLLFCRNSLSSGSSCS